MDGSLPHQRQPGWYQKCLFSGIAMQMGAGIVGHQQEATLLNEMGRVEIRGLRDLEDGLHMSLL